MNLPVEVIANGRKLRAVSQDVSPFGMFVRLAPPLPVGTPVQVVMSPNGDRLTTTGQVTHVLTESEARTLGRFPGCGIVFREVLRPTDEAFHDAIVRLLASHATRPRQAADIRIVVADPQTRVLERLSTALGGAGFSVATATNGMEAIGACLSRTPDVVLLERDMPVVDGLHVLQEMGRHAQLASVPAMLMSGNATDLVRLQAFQLGAADFIPKPFTVLEVILRARRWARASQRDTERVVLRGALADLALPSLLTMFEQDRTTGQRSASPASSWSRGSTSSMVASSALAPASSMATRARSSCTCSTGRTGSSSCQRRGSHQQDRARRLGAAPAARARAAARRSRPAKSPPS